MSIGNVTMVIVVIENSQIQNAVDMQSCMSCEMQLNFVGNVHVAVHISTFQRNKKCISLSEHWVYQWYIVDIYTQQDKHGPIASAAHSADTLHIPHIPTDTLHTDLDTLRRSHTQFWRTISKLKVMPELCAQLCNLPFEIVSKSVLNLYKVYQHVMLQGVWHTKKQNCDFNVIVQNWFGK